MRPSRDIITKLHLPRRMIHCQNSEKHFGTVLMERVGRFMQSHLGKELGLYEDPYQYFGTLSAEMHRAIRLVVDTGLHAMGWTREQAIQYSLENEAESEASITSEIERYMANPAQALSYKIGQLKILELRNRAEKALGANFDIKEFHQNVLETGCIPLAILEEQIDAWITSKSMEL